MRFSVKTLEKIWVISDASGNHLDCDQPPDCWVDCFIDDTHATSANHIEDFVFADFCEPSGTHLLQDLNT